MISTGQGGPILQGCLPFTPWADPALSRMPGLAPVEGSWIVVDDAYTAQMRERTRLLAKARDRVVCALPGSEPVVDEALRVVLASLPAGFAVGDGIVTCPDNRRVEISGAPLDTVCRLIQEDLLILDRRGEEHVLIAGLLCFPASWTLAEKIGRPLTRIHAPVESYDADLASRVQRLFDRVPSDRAMWRANALGYAEAELHQPRTERAPRADAPARFLRSERQSVMRLPKTGAVLFAVHTYVVAPHSLTAAQRATCPIAFAG